MKSSLERQLGTQVSPARHIVPASKQEFSELLGNMHRALELALASDKRGYLSPDRRARIVARVKGISPQVWASAISANQASADAKLADAEENIALRIAAGIIAAETGAEIRAFKSAAYALGRKLATAAAEAFAASVAADPDNAVPLTLPVTAEQMGPRPVPSVPTE